MLRPTQGSPNPALVECDSKVAHVSRRAVSPFVATYFFNNASLSEANDKDRRTERDAAEDPATQTTGPLANSQPPNPPEAEVRPSAQRRTKDVYSS